MLVKKYTSDFKDKWNKFLLNAKNSTFIFNRDFMEYHKNRFNDYSLMVLDNSNNIMALLPANISEKNLLISHQGLTYGGLVVAKEENLSDVIEYFKAILSYLHNSGFKKFLCKEIPSFYNDIPSDELQYCMFLSNAELVRRDTAITIKIDSKLPLQKRRVRSIKTALKLEAIIKEEKSFDSFWNLILIPNLLKRFNVKPVHSLEEITLLHNYFPNNIRQFNTYINGEIMAGTTIFETPFVAHAQYISASDEGRKNGSLDLLFHNLIENVFNKKRYFDFGICNEENGRKFNQGLLEWKEGFGGRTFSHNFYEVNTGNFHF